MLDVGKLATLRAVVAHGSFSAAAAELSLTQPAVSRQVSLLERQVGTQLVRRTRSGTHPTEAGRLLCAHAEAVLTRLTLAEQELGELTGLRRGTVRLGSFFTALVHLSAAFAVQLQAEHPGLVVADTLVDRRAAFAGLADASLDVAIVFEPDFEPDPAPDAIEVISLFDDPVRVLLPGDHRLAAEPAVSLEALAGETWIRSHDGSAARLVDHVLRAAGLDPPILHAGHGDEPVETQVLVAAGKGVTLAHELNVIIGAVAVRPLAPPAPVRHIQAAILRDNHSPAARVGLEALRRIRAAGRCDPPRPSRSGS
jgi:DNA-binding transcriptional LysR family regulator